LKFLLLSNFSLPSALFPFPPNSLPKPFHSLPLSLTAHRAISWQDLPSKRFQELEYDTRKMDATKPQQLWVYDQDYI